MAAAKDGNRLNRCVHSDPSLPWPAAEILDYLARHPDAQDTLDGILQWWLLEEYIRKCSPVLTLTVAHLVERGFLEEKRSPDGVLFYRASLAYLRSVTPPTRSHQQ